MKLTFYWDRDIPLKKRSLRCGFVTKTKDILQIGVFMSKIDCCSIMMVIACIVCPWLFDFIFLSNFSCGVQARSKFPCSFLYTKNWTENSTSETSSCYCSFLWTSFWHQDYENWGSWDCDDFRANSNIAVYQHVTRGSLYLRPQGRD